MLPIVSSGLLTGTVFGWLFYQFMSSVEGMFAAIVMGVVVTTFYCALMDKVLGGFLRRAKRDDA